MPDTDPAQDPTRSAQPQPRPKLTLDIEPLDERSSRHQGEFVVVLKADGTTLFASTSMGIDDARRHQRRLALTLGLMGTFTIRLAVSDTATSVEMAGLNIQDALRRLMADRTNLDEYDSITIMRIK